MVFGIDEEIRVRVFGLSLQELLKKVGTGLGLYQVEEAVEQMGRQNWIGFQFLTEGNNNLGSSFHQWNNIFLEIVPLGSKSEFKILLTTYLWFQSLARWSTLDEGKCFLKVVTGVIEIPKGSKGEYVIGIKRQACLMLGSRAILSAVHYPGIMFYPAEFLPEDHYTIGYFGLFLRAIFPPCV